MMETHLEFLGMLTLMLSEGAVIRFMSDILPGRAESSIRVTLVSTLALSIENFSKFLYLRPRSDDPIYNLLKLMFIKLPKAVPLFCAKLPFI